MFVMLAISPLLLYLFHMSIQYTYLNHVLDTDAQNGPGTFASGCSVRQYTIQPTQYTTYSIPNVLAEGSGICSNKPIAWSC